MTWSPPLSLLPKGGPGPHHLKRKVRVETGRNSRGRTGIQLGKFDSISSYHSHALAHVILSDVQFPL